MNTSLLNSNVLILVIEDEPEIAEIIVAYLAHEGFNTMHANNGEDGLNYWRKFNPNLVLLDIRIPGHDGIDILQAIRNERSTPIIMLTALSDDVNKILSLRLGADDYITKPFNPAEMVARVRALLRRATKTESVSTTARVGPLLIDNEAHTAALNDDLPLPLTLTEFRLLAHMARQPGRCFSRLDLIEACLPQSDALDRVIDSHLSKLRRKLIDAGSGDLIETIRGVGYRLCVTP
jgi:two-component system response regulator AdeR